MKKVFYMAALLTAGILNGHAATEGVCDACGSTLTGAGAGAGADVVDPFAHLSPTRRMEKEINDKALRLGNPQDFHERSQTSTSPHEVLENSALEVLITEAKPGLEITGCELSTENVTTICDALKSGTLKSLGLEHIKMSDDDAKALFIAVAESPSLLFFDIENFSKDLADHFINILGLNKKLIRLGIGNIKFGNAGVIEVIDSISADSALKQLYLHSNEIGDEGATACAEFLKTNPKLEELYLPFNEITDVGAEALLEALKINTNLKTLYLGDAYAFKAVHVGGRDIHTDSRFLYDALSSDS